MLHFAATNTYGPMGPFGTGQFKSAVARKLLELLWRPIPREHGSSLLIIDGGAFECPQKNIFAPALLSGLSALFLLGLSGCGSSNAPAIAVDNGAQRTQSSIKGATVAITASVCKRTRRCEWRGAFRVAGTLTNQTTTSLHTITRVGAWLR